MIPSELHIVVPGPLDGLTGGYVYDAHMAAGLRDLGWEVHVHDLAGRFPDADDVARHALSSTLGSLPDGTRVVIDGLAMGALPAPVEAHGGRLRLLSLVHHPLALETGLSRAEAARLAGTERRALESCVGVIVSSAHTARGLAAYGVSADRIRVAVPGVDPVAPAVGPGPDKPPRLLCVASLTPRKGHEVLVAALERVRDLDWTCVFAGGDHYDPACADRVRRLVVELGLGDRVELVGERAGERLEALYRSASAFTLASHYEGYGMALAEALAHGLPVVSTTAGAIPFTVPTGAGILVEPGDVAAFAHALRTLLAPDPSVRAGLAAAALRHAATLPSWSEAVRDFAAAVDELTR